MTQKEKSILLKDLSARLPYGVIVYDYDRKETREMGLGTFHDIMFNDLECKPYLRPMSSMTGEEKRHISKMMCLSTYDDGVVYDMTYPVYTPYYVMEDCLSYLRSIHVDYSGLTEKGLALEAPEGMYNLKEK